jgi:hypothetical protein
MQLNPLLDQGAGLGTDRSQTRQADTLIPVWSMGHQAAIEVTVVHPLNHDVIVNQGATTSARSCLKAESTRKHNENDEKCEALGWHWQCIVFVYPSRLSLRCLWEEATAALARIARRIAVQEHQTENEALHELLGRLSMVQPTVDMHHQSAPDTTDAR